MEIPASFSCVHHVLRLDGHGPLEQNGTLLAVIGRIQRIKILENLCQLSAGQRFAGAEGSAGIAGHEAGPQRGGYGGGQCVVDFIAVSHVLQTAALGVAANVPGIIHQNFGQRFALNALPPASPVLWAQAAASAYQLFSGTSVKVELSVEGLP